MMLPDAYLRAVGDAVHAVDGLFVLDCVASGTIWVDMVASDVDVLISAPAERLERLALLRAGHAGRTRADAHRRARPAPASPAI